VESRDPGATEFEPRRPGLVAALVFLVPVVVLCWPIASGFFLGGVHSDQYVAGYAFREFGADYFRTFGSIPQWNPYLFGGMPFIAASSGDIFYPTAWLRWILPVGTAMALGMAVHLYLAGAFCYALLRSLRCGWAGAIVGGLAYELSGILASLVHPGHDGKLFVSALAPLLLLALLRAIRDGRLWGYGLAALTVGLCILTPHPQMTYYLLVAAGIWTLYLVFFDPERSTVVSRPVALALAAAAVVVGVGIGGIFVVPFFGYMPYSPRAAGESASSWEYATSYALPLEELFGVVLPQFVGLGPDAYWGGNFAKLHTEYLGASVLVLAAFGITARKRQRLLLVLAGIAGLFLLVSLGSDTPFYRAWYELLPYMKKVRAPGMAFYLVALPVAAFAAFGADRVFRREVSARAVFTGFGIIAAIGLLAVVGALQPIAEGLAVERMMERAIANGPGLVAGGFRLLGIALVAGGAVWLVTTGRVRALGAAALLAFIIAADLWSVDRRFFVFDAKESELFATDPITEYLEKQPKPYRVLDTAYPGDFLMAHEVQTVLGYHGNEVRFYDDLWGGKSIYGNLGNANLWDLWAVQHLILREEQPVPGFHKVIGPLVTTPDSPAVLYERDSLVPYARVVPGALKAAEEQIIPTVLDPGFPLETVVLFSDSASLAPPPIRAGALPAATTVRARVTEWIPGRMTIALDGQDARTTYLLVAETWYPDWGATIDGNPATVHRANYAQIGLELPPGAREVRLQFRSRASATGAVVTWLCLVAALAGIGVPLLRRGRA
jgi:hypothetical protein